MNRWNSESIVNRAVSKKRRRHAARAEWGRSELSLLQDRESSGKLLGDDVYGERKQAGGDKE